MEETNKIAENELKNAAKVQTCLMRALANETAKNAPDADVIETVFDSLMWLWDRYGLGGIDDYLDNKADAEA